MKLETTKLDNDITQVTLVGRLDLLGTQEIDLKFTAVTSSEKASVLVDLSGVEFMASIGMRTLLSSAKAQANRGGKLVLLNPTPMVMEVFTMAGIDQLIPIYDNLEEALNTLSA